MNKLIPIFVFLIIMISSSVFAQTYYVRADALGSGSGMDWTNAFTNIPETLVRGSMYYISTGDYGIYSCDDAVDGETYITIKKATQTDHGTSDGWDDSYENGQVFFDQLGISTHYWIIDGAERSNWDSEYGIRVKPTVVGDKAIRLSQNVKNVTLKYIEVERRGQLYEEKREDGIYGQKVDNITVQYCFVHNIMGNAILLHGKNNIIENSMITETYGFGGVHSQGVQLFAQTENTTIRNNIFKNIIGTAAIACAWGTNGLNVYGNVFYNTTTEISTSPAAIVDISDADGSTGGLTDAKIYNNLFYNYKAATGYAGVSVRYSPDPESNEFYNNYFYECSNRVTIVNIKHDYNYLLNSEYIYNTVLSEHEVQESGGADPFVNAAEYDFHLKSRTMKGIVLAEPFNVDPSGIIRGQDRTWDVGAYEYAAGPNEFYASISVNTDIGYTPLTVEFDGSSSFTGTGSITSYEWDFDDGQSSIVVNPSHTYSEGEYTVILTVTNSSDKTASTQRIIRVKPAVEPDQVLYLDFNDSVDDISGHNQQTSWSAAEQYAQGVKYSSARFDGTNGSCVIVNNDDSLNGMDDLTIALWAKKAIASEAATLFTKHTAYNFKVSATGVTGYLFNESTSRHNFSSSTGTNDIFWHHYALTYNGANIILYIDGEEAFRTQMTGDVTTNTRELIIGRGLSGNCFDGLIDEFKIYTRALSPQEISELADYEYSGGFCITPIIKLLLLNEREE